MVYSGSLVSIQLSKLLVDQGCIFRVFVEINIKFFLNIVFVSYIQIIGYQFLNYNFRFNLVNGICWFLSVKVCRNVFLNYFG